MIEAKSNVLQFPPERMRAPGRVERTRRLAHAEMTCPKCNSFMWPVSTKPAAVLGDMGLAEEGMQCEACPYSEPRLV